ncbi:MAG: hypothetical protein GX225_03920 [Clostridiales bacterium]|nr:hypothetical protein [Clostridiales bacterium]
MIDNKDLDWKYLEENYKESDRKVRSFEEIMNECESTHEDDKYDTIGEAGSALLETVENVKKIREMSSQAKTVKEMAETLNLKEEYVTTIMIILNSSTDDDNDVAIAHLVMMS